jgi:hypothetical protein
MYYPDLSTECQLGIGDDIRAIGWLSKDHQYRKGYVPNEFTVKLRQHCEEAWEPFMSMGVHICEFCERDPDENGSNIWIPAKRVVYIAPAMILHYVICHEYQPPLEFIDAVLACPQQGSSDFMEMMTPYLHYWDM